MGLPHSSIEKARWPCSQAPDQPQLWSAEKWGGSGTFCNYHVSDVRALVKRQGSVQLLHAWGWSRLDRNTPWKFGQYNSKVVFPKPWQRHFHDLNSIHWVINLRVIWSVTTHCWCQGHYGRLCDVWQKLGGCLFLYAAHPQHPASEWSSSIDWSFK